MIVLDTERHIYKLADGTEIPSVSEIIKDGLNIQYVGLNDFYATRGKYIHKAIELFNKNVLDMNSLVPHIQNFFQSYLSFHNEYIQKVIEIEKIVYNEELRYAGTLDMVVKLKYSKEPIIIDIKTGSYQGFYELQTAGYWLAYGNKKCKRGLLMLDNEGKQAKLIMCENKRDMDVFKGLVHLYYWKKENKIL